MIFVTRVALAVLAASGVAWVAEHVAIIAILPLLFVIDAAIEVWSFR